MQRHRNRIILILLFLIISVLIYIIIQIKFNNETVKPEIIWNEQEMNFSRISFFNTQKHKASMAIPEHWEGRYRMKDEGNIVVFFNIDDPQKPKELFRIKSIEFTKFNPSLSEGWHELSKQNDVQFVYKLSTGRLKEEAGNDKMSKMFLELEYILKSFKSK